MSETKPKFKISFTTMIILGTILGAITGLIIGPKIDAIRFIGDIFLRLIQMSIVILIMGAVIEAVGSLNPKDLGKLGGKIFLLFIISTAIAAALGILLGNIIQPGAGISFPNIEPQVLPDSNKTVLGMVMDFVPKNIVESMANAQMIHVIIFSLIFGLAISITRETDTSNSMLKVIKDFNVVILTVVKLVMKIAPLGVFALMSWVTGTIGIKVMLPLVKFLGSMAIGTILILIGYTIITSIKAKVSPIKLIMKLSKTSIVALTTTSSAITLPTKMEDQENKIGISKRISRLVGPLGMSLNSNGQSLYLALACITIGQVFNLNLTLSNQIQIVVMSTLACLGTVAVPGGGIVALALVLNIMDLPPSGVAAGIALLSGIDWFSGMFRTLLNVLGDVYIALMVAVDEKEFDRDIFDNSTN